MIWRRIDMKITTAATIFAAAMVSMVASAPAFASSLCTNTTDCTLTLNDSNVNGLGNYGTVTLVDNGIVNHGPESGKDDITITVNLTGTLGIDNPDYQYPGDFGFTDSLGTGSGLYIGNFDGTDPSNTYSGYNVTGLQSFDGFGKFNIAAATYGPSSGGSNIVTFDVYQNGLNNVNDLLNLGSGGTGYFVVNDHCDYCDPTPQLLAVTAATTPTPEPSTYAFTLLGLAGIAFAYSRKNKLAQAAK
jgi:hypothetical protein